MMLPTINTPTSSLKPLALEKALSLIPKEELRCSVGSVESPLFKNGEVIVKHFKLESVTDPGEFFYQNVYLKHYGELTAAKPGLFEDLVEALHEVSTLLYQESMVAPTHYILMPERMLMLVLDPSRLKAWYYLDIENLTLKTAIVFNPRDVGSVRVSADIMKSLPIKTYNVRGG